MTEPSEAAKAKAIELLTDEAHRTTWYPDDYPVQKVAAFIQEVSDKAGYANETGILDPFILPEPDPLIGVVEEAIAGTAENSAKGLREELAKRGLKIVKDET